MFHLQKAFLVNNQVSIFKFQLIKNVKTIDLPPNYYYFIFKIFN